MKKLIRHIRKQPEETRRHILHILTLMCAVILLSLWVYSLGQNFNSTETQVKVNDTVKPFTALTNGLSSTW